MAPPGATVPMQVPARSKPLPPFVGEQQLGELRGLAADYGHASVRCTLAQA